MTALRQSPTETTYPGGIAGDDYAAALNTEIGALWNYVTTPLGTIGGSAVAITAVGAVPLIADPVNGQRFSFRPTLAPTGATTLAIDGRGPFPVKTIDGNALAGGEWKAGRQVELVSDGTNLRIAGIVNDVLPVGYRKLASGVIASAVATFDLALTSYTAFSGFKIALSNFHPATDNVDLYMRLSTDGGATFDATSGNYKYAGVEAYAGGGSNGSGTLNNGSTTGAAQMDLQNAIGNGAAEGVSAELTLLDPFNAAVKTRLLWQVVSYGAGDGVSTHFGGGFRDIAQDTDAVRFLFSSGNIASGKWGLYGLV